MSTPSTSAAARELPRSEWVGWFTELDRRLEDGARFDAAIEVAGEKVDGTAAEGLPLNSITYEDGDDAIAIGVGGRGSRFPSVLWHFAEHPARIWVREEDGVPRSIGLESEDGTYTFIRLDPA